jgi:AcrR family transcriptional regulator
MVRWEPDSRRRLEQAALALYGDHGFENTTVAEISERAGLTERTFFRHFADKREVLFSGARALQDLLVATVAAAPEGTKSIDAVAAALEAAAAMFESRRDSSMQRQAVIVANAELRERELIKLATLSAALADALRSRGEPATAATLTAEAGIAVFKVSFELWVDENNRAEFRQIIQQSFEAMRAALVG